MTLQNEDSDEEDQSNKAKRQKLDSESIAENKLEQTLRDGSILSMKPAMIFRNCCKQVVCILQDMFLVFQ